MLAAPLTRRRFSSSIGRLISFDQVSPPDRILSYRFALWEPIRQPQVSNPDASSVRKITAEAFPASIKAASFPFWVIFSSILPGWRRAHGRSALLLTRMLCISEWWRLSGMPLVARSSILSARTLILPERPRSRTKSRMPRSASRRVPDLALGEIAKIAGFRLRELSPADA